MAIANLAAPIYGNLTTGAIFKDLSFTNYENTAGIIIAGTTLSFAQYNDIVRPLWSDTLSGVVFSGQTADNRIWGGRFLGSRVGGGAVIASQGNGGAYAGGYTWVYGTNCQYAPVCYYQLDQAGASVEMKAENTYGISPVGAAPMIGSPGTGTFAVFDGQSSTTNCVGNRVDNVQVGFFGLGLYNSANCTGTRVGLFRFKQTAFQYNDNSPFPMFLPYAITPPGTPSPLATTWTTGTNINNVVLCVANDNALFPTDCPAGLYRVDFSIIQPLVGNCTGNTPQGRIFANVSWTDDANAARTHFIPLGGDNASDLNGAFNTTGAMALQYATGMLLLRSNGTANITYSINAPACTMGSATGSLYATITRLSAD